MGGMQGSDPRAGISNGMKTMHNTSARAWAHRVPLLALALAACIGTGASLGTAHAEDGMLRPLNAPDHVARRGDFGAAQLERLPWPVHVLQANLSKDRPVAIAGVYLMDRHLIVVAQSGLVYCLDRFNLEPRWVSSLRAPLFRAPAEGPGHFVFLVKDHCGAYWIHSIAKRSGEEASAFPKRLGFAASSGVAVNASSAFLGSLGSVGSNRTVESVNLATGRGGWGWLASGLVFGPPQLDETGQNVVFGTDDGRVISLPAGALPPRSANWERAVGSSVRHGVAVSPNVVVVGARDGVVHGLDADTGSVRWLANIGGEIQGTPWILGSEVTVLEDTGIEGAEPIARRVYTGVAFTRNVRGLTAFNLASGEIVFRDLDASRPLVRHGDWLLTLDNNRVVTFRNSKANYEPGAETLDLGMLDLVPTNRLDGAIYAATSDGTILAAIPR